MFTAQIYDKNTSKDNLLNRNGIATLNKLTKCISKERLNGEYELEAEYPLDDPKAINFNKWNVIKADGQLFRIYNIQEDMVKHTLNTKSRHIFYDLDDAFMIDNRADKKTVKEAMEIALKCDDMDKLFTVDSDIEEINTLYMIEQSPLTSMFEIINRWKRGELIRDNFNITIRNDVEYSSGIEIRYRKNMLSLNKETDTDRVCTRIYPKGKGGVTLPEKYVYVPGMKPGDINSPPRQKTKLIKFDEAEDVVNLRILSERYVDKLAFPFENIKVDFLDVTTLDKFENIEGLKQVKIGDVVEVYHDLYNKHYKFKCVYIERDLLNSENTKVELGEIREYFDNIDFSEVYDAIESSKPALYFYRNEEDLNIKSDNYTQLFYEGISVNSNTHLKLYIALNGVSEVENILDIQILVNNNSIEFTPKHKLNIGYNVIGIPLAIPALQGGEAYYVSVKVKTDKGTFIISKSNAQVFAEGVGLSGGTSSDKPHIENIDYLNMKMENYIYDNSTITKQVPLKGSLVNDNIIYSSKNETTDSGKISLIKVLDDFDFNKSQSTEFIFDDTKISFNGYDSQSDDDTYIDFIDNIDTKASKQDFNGMYLYSANMPKLSNYKSIEKEYFYE